MTQGRGPHRLPRVPRRPGQDAASAGARRHPRRPPPRDPRATSSPSSASSRSTWWSPTSTRSAQTVHLGRVARRVRRADRHRRAVDGARGRQEPPVGRDRHLARPVRRACSPRSPTVASRSSSASGSPPRPSRTPRRTTCGRLVDGQRAHRHQRRHRLPGVHRGDLGAGGCAPLRREPAPARAALYRALARRPGRCRAAARQGDVLQQLRRHRCRAPRAPTTSPSRRSRSSSTRTRAASRSAPTSPRHTRKANACDPVSAFGGVIAVNRPVVSRWPSRCARPSPRRSSPRLRRRCGRGAAVAARAAARTSGSWCARRTSTRTRSSSAASAAACSMQTRRPRRRRRRRPVDLDACVPARRPPTEMLADLAFAWKACRAVKSNAILLASGRRLGRHRHGPGQPRRLGSARGEPLR